jgi:AcrR family transcriptional regulator
LTGIAPGDVPARGKRPRNRRDIIITAAAELFAAEGFANVSMSDIAAAVNVQPSALYRHFSGKNEILREAISRGARLRQEAVALGEPVDLEETLLDMAHMALETRRASVLWTTEVRNLDDETRRDLRREMRALPAAFTERLTSVRSELGPRHVELLAWAALDVLASISFHEERLPNREFVSVLRDAMQRIVMLELPAGADEVPDDVLPVVRTVRRDAVLRAAARLFSHRGYHAVTLDDIGASAGIAGASIYNYFPSKQHLVAALITRSVEWMEFVTSSALRGLEDPAERLDALVRSWVQFTFYEPALVALLLTEIPHLPEDVAAQVNHIVKELVGEWVDLVRLLDPERDQTVARIQVQAARMVALDILITPSLRQTPGLGEILVAACRATLDV